MHGTHSSSHIPSSPTPPYPLPWMGPSWRTYRGSNPVISGTPVPATGVPFGAAGEDGSSSSSGRGGGGLLLTRTYVQGDFDGFDTETDPHPALPPTSASASSPPPHPSAWSTVPPGWQQPISGEWETTPPSRSSHIPTSRRQLLPPIPDASSYPSLPSSSPASRPRRRIRSWIGACIRSLFILLLGVLITTAFFVAHILPLLPPWSASSPLSAWIPLTTARHAVVTATPLVGGSMIMITPPPPVPVPVSPTPPQVSTQPVVPPQMATQVDSCLVGTSQIEDATGKGEIDAAVVQQELTAAHLSMFVRVEEDRVSSSSQAVTNEEQFGRMMQVLYGTRTLGPIPPGGIETPIDHEFCSLYLVINTTHDWVAIGGKPGVAPLSADDYQTAMTLYHQVEQASGGKHTGAVLSVLGYLHSVLEARPLAVSPPA